MLIFEFILFLILFLILIGTGVFGLFALMDSIFIRVPFISTRKQMVNQIIQSLNLSDSSTLYDLGSGDGRILIKALEENSNIIAIGIEKGILPYFIGKFKTRNLPIKMQRVDIFNIDLQDATHIYVYLLPHIIEKLGFKIAIECKKGTRIVSCDYPFHNLKIIQEIKIKTPKKTLGKMLYIHEA